MAAVNRSLLEIAELYRRKGTTNAWLELLYRRTVDKP